MSKHTPHGAWRRAEHSGTPHIIIDCHAERGMPSPISGQKDGGDDTEAGNESDEADEKQSGGEEEMLER